MQKKVVVSSGSILALVIALLVYLFLHTYNETSKRN